MQIDKENEYVTYNDEQHLYIEKSSGKKCISVTTLIESFGQPFDSDFWASYKALESLIGEEEYEKIKKDLLKKKKFDPKILDNYSITMPRFLEEKTIILNNWKNKNKEACERGTKIHKQMENLTLSGKCKELQRLGLGGKFECRTNNKIELNGSGVYPEILLNYTSPDGTLRLAGQADLVIVQGTNLYILDFKTNQEIKKGSYYNAATKSRQMMQYPLNHIQDCNFWHYTLQLSTYAWMIQKQYPELEVKLLQLIHYDHNDKVTFYDCEYRKDDVERMLKFYGSKLKKQEMYEKLKPIVY